MVHRRISAIAILVHIAIAQYARLTDEHYSIHFPEDTTPQIEIPGVDNRFQALTFSEDYSMMSWVQIQEQEPKAYAWETIWKIEHGGQFSSWNFAPDLKWTIAQYFLITINTSTSENLSATELYITQSFPLWVHISIRVCGSMSEAHAWVQEWLGFLNCQTFSLDGAVFPFDLDSTVIIGGRNDRPEFNIHPKMQVLDLRYYSGNCMIQSDLEDIINNSHICHSTCTGCWGPGNYSWNEFITFIDPHVKSSYAHVLGSDSFLMGRTYNSADTAWSGWVFQGSGGISLAVIGANDYQGIFHIEENKPTMSYQNGAYHYQHNYDSANYNEAIQPTHTSPENDWNFVVGSTCGTVPQLHSCYGLQSGSMYCDSNSDNANYLNFQSAGDYLEAGSTDYTDTILKDVRYYYNICLNPSDMESIKNNFTWKQLCAICSDPNTCDTCITGYKLFSGECAQCHHPCSDCDTLQTNCTSCFSPYFLLGNSCQTTCGSNYWGKTPDNTCEPCNSACFEWYGPIDSECSACNNGYYLQPIPNEFSCYNTCPDGWAPQDTDNTCQPCHPTWLTCIDITDQDCRSCDSGRTLDGTATSPWFPCYIGCESCQGTSQTDWLSCLAGYFDQGFPGAWSECDSSCATCSGPTATDWITWFDLYAVVSSDGYCEWSPSYFDSDETDSLLCSQCASECYQCYGSANDNWLSCSDLHYVLPDTSLSCRATCPPSYWPDSEELIWYTCVDKFYQCNEFQECRCNDGNYYAAGDCFPWLAEWETWEDGQSCISCKSGYVLINSQWYPCSDFEGYDGGLDNPSGDNVEARWLPVCGDGIVLQGEICEEDGRDDFSGWVEQCESEEGETNSDEENNHQPLAKLEFNDLTDDVYDFLLFFDKPVVLSQDFGLSVELPDEIVDYSLVSAPSDKIEYSAYSLQLTISSEVPSDTIAVFIIEGSVKGENDLELSNYEIEISLEEKVTTMIIEAAYVEAAQGAQTATVAIIAGSLVSSVAGSNSVGDAGANRVSSLLSMDLVTVWAMIEILQIMSQFQYITAINDVMEKTKDSSTSSAILQTEFQMMQFSNGDFIPNVFPYFVDDTGQKPPEIYEEDGLYTNLLLNCGNIIGVALINLVLLIVVSGLSKLFPKVKLISNQRHLLMTAIPLRTALEGAIEIFLAIMLQCRKLPDGNINDLLGGAACIVCISGYLFLTFLVWKKIIVKDEQELASPDYVKKYGTLYECYKTENAVEKGFVILDMVRKIIFLSILVFLTGPQWKELQIFALILHQIAFIIFSGIVRPFTKQKQNVLKILMELLILIIFILSAALLDSNRNESEILDITWTLVGILGFMFIVFLSYVLIFGLVGMLIGSAKGVLQMCSKLKQRYTKWKSQPRRRNRRRVYLTLGESSKVNVNIPRNRSKPREVRPRLSPRETMPHLSPREDKTDFVYEWG